jgi:FAD/FMN-containing dehydrogenase
VIGDRVRSLLGPDTVVGTAAGGQPIVAPRDEDGVALLLRAASAHGWGVRIAGLGRWRPDDGPADLILSTRRIDRPVEAVPEDLVATADAGLAWSAMQATLAEAGVWVGIDHPGGERSVGSVAATATAGALSSGMGRVRDHVLGLTLVTGEGRIVRAGGTVVKNVAGYDLSKLAIGSFGAFGVVTSVTFRLRAVPRADQTLHVLGQRDQLLEAALAVTEAGIIPSALELRNAVRGEDASWSLAVRALGRSAEVRATLEAVRQEADLPWDTVDADAAAAFWRDWQHRAVRSPTTIRLGCVPTALARGLDAVERIGPDTGISVSVAAGSLRVTTDCGPGAIDRLRHLMTEIEVPVTVERGPWSTLAAAGHFGAYREGVGPLVTRLRATFDPKSILVVPVGAGA